MGIFDPIDTATEHEIAKQTRILELVGYSVSALSLFISIYIYRGIPSLRNLRTTIHLCLFAPMLVLDIIRLALYIDQALFMGNEMLKGIHNSIYICEAFYILQEYSISATLTWMLIEGIFINKYISYNAIEFQFHFNKYACLGWTMPLLNVMVWAAFTGVSYGRQNVNKCWFGYNFNPFYWIVQGPRLIVILVNFCLLIKIMNILVTKLRESSRTDIQKIKTASKAALILLPLLGITNVLSIIETETWNVQIWVFALWSYTTHFLRSFQGTFLAVSYCFLNRDVQVALRRRIFRSRVMLFPHVQDLNRPLERQPAIRRRPLVRAANNPLRSYITNESELPYPCTMEMVQLHANRENRRLNHSAVLHGNAPAWNSAHVAETGSVSNHAKAKRVRFADEVSSRDIVVEPVRESTSSDDESV